jgi:hypothetical protein
VVVNSVQAMEHEIANAMATEADLLIRPSVPQIHWAEFHRAKELIIKGEEAGTGLKTFLVKLISPSTEADKALKKYSLTVASFRNDAQQLGNASILLSKSCVGVDDASQFFRSITNHCCRAASTARTVVGRRRAITCARK